MTQKEALKEMRGAGGWMLANQYRKLDGRPLFPTIDLGPVATAEAAYNALLEMGVPKKFFCVEGHARLIASVPDRLTERVLADERVSDQPTYWNITHSWKPLSTSQPTTEEKL